MPKRSSLHWTAHSPERFVERISPVAPSPRIEPQTLRYFASVEMAPLTSLGLFTITMDHCVVRSPDLQYVSITLPLGGAFQASPAGTPIVFSRGTAMANPPSRPFYLRTADTGRLLVYNVEAVYLATLWGALEGADAPTTPTIATRLSLTTLQGAAFYRMLIRLWSARADGRPESRLSALEDERMLATAFLSANAIGAESRRPAETAAGTRLKRARDYIEAHVSAATGLADIAAAAGMRGDSLSRAFTRRFGMGPMAYLRQRRLEAVHRALLGADPGSTTTFRVALGYGFNHPSRFARMYRQSFGELPSTTLAR